VAGAGGSGGAVVDDLVDDGGGVKRLKHVFEGTAATALAHREVTPT
jgi:hypothetical protein